MTEHESTIRNEIEKEVRAYINNMLGGLVNQHHGPEWAKEIVAICRKDQNIGK